jgi:hypothetical protein
MSSEDEHTHCPVCYWESKVKRIESEIADVELSPAERRMRIQQDEEAIRETGGIPAKYRSQYRDRQAWWRRLLRLYPDDDQIKRLRHRLNRLQAHLERFQHVSGKDTEELRERLYVAKSELRRARERRDQRRARDRLDEETRSRFAEQCRESLQLGFEIHQFRIRDQDYQPANFLDDFFLTDFKASVLAAFDGRCVRCGKRRELGLDHYGVVKSEGGNFLLCCESHRALKPNVIVICRSCTVRRTLRRNEDFFTEREIKRIRLCHADLLEVILRDPEVLFLARRWYRGGP